MPAPSTYDYAIVRVVPRVERDEFINVGVVLFSRTRRFLAAQIELDEERLLALAPEVDLPALRTQLALIPQMCAGAGPIGCLGQAETFHWLVSPHSTMIQTSAVHSGLGDDPAAALEHLMETMVRVRK